MSSRRRWFFIAFGLLACSCVGVVAVNTVRNFVRFGQRAKAAECKSNLKAWSALQKRHFQDTKTYEPVFAKVGFAPERGNRYAYFAGRGPMEVRDQERSEAPEGAMAIGADTFRFTYLRPFDVQVLHPSLKARLGVSGTCPACDITLVCVGNTDEDATLDVWVLSTGALDLQDVDGETAEPGVPVHLVDDTKD
ncbi:MULTISPECIES: fimbrial protein [unclassified Corallococcus]|uniref:fimbrial protein n=1 Tax=unclassified Corallococcus TaxID=2685029 RepID=UPI001A90885E|nr:MULTISPECIES: fimbrial protein [unclassified Corallococcus]MBN9685971.1 fimbrial protein [Corallococcus sp. NCSPR001]WAS82589.1 fimbrial protein [Corallococcus sp. NCRR]